MRHAEAERRDGNAAAVENLQAVDETFAFVAQADFRAAIWQSVKITSLVSLARRPSLFSFLPGLNPGVPFSMMNAEIPWLFFDGIGDGHAHADVGVMAVGGESFRAVDDPAAVRFAALVRVPPASEPASGSVSDQQPSFFPCASGITYFFFCSSVPNL